MFMRNKRCWRGEGKNTREEEEYKITRRRNEMSWAKKKREGKEKHNKGGREESGHNVQKEGETDYGQNSKKSKSPSSLPGFFKEKNRLPS